MIDGAGMMDAGLLVVGCHLPLCRLMCTKNKNPSHMSVHVCHTWRVPHLTHYKHLPPLTRIPRSLLGEIPRLGLDRADGRRFVALIFVLFRDIFKAILPFFWWSPPLGRATGLSDVCDPITPVGFRPAWRPTDAKCQFEGRSHFSDVRNPPTSSST